MYSSLPANARTEILVIWALGWVVVDCSVPGPVGVVEHCTDGPWTLQKTTPRVGGTSHKWEFAQWRACCDGVLLSVVVFLWVPFPPPPALGRGTRNLGVSVGDTNASIYIIHWKIRRLVLIGMKACQLSSVTWAEEERGN